MKQNIFPIVTLVLAIVLGGIIINHQRSKVKYVDTTCPSCGSHEVLDFGLTDEGNQRAHCFGCRVEFTILNY